MEEELVVYYTVGRGFTASSGRVIKENSGEQVIRMLRNEGWKQKHNSWRWNNKGDIAQMTFKRPYREPDI